MREVYIMKVKAINEVTLEFPSRSSNEGFARSAVACFAAQLDPTLNELEDIKTSVSEAVTNAIVHAYPDDLGKVLLKVRICPGNVLEITVRDHGRGIPDVEKVLLVKDQPDEFAETVVELYKDEKRLEDLAEKTQVYIREHFSIDAAWDVIKEDFE